MNYFITFGVKFVAKCGRYVWAKKISRNFEETWKSLDISKHVQRAS